MIESKNPSLPPPRLKLASQRDTKTKVETVALSRSGFSCPPFTQVFLLKDFYPPQRKEIIASFQNNIVEETFVNLTVRHQKICQINFPPKS